VLSRHQKGDLPSWRFVDSERVAGLLVRHPLPAAICGIAIAIVAGVFIFARPQYRAANGTTIRIPDKHPAADAAGRAGWVWPDGVPGWEPGEQFKGYPISQLQAIEAQPAQLTAAHAGLDAEQVRVLDAMHVVPGEGPIAVFAAPMLDVSPRTICIAAMLPNGSTTQWRCPGTSRPYRDVANSRVFVAAVSQLWSKPVAASATTPAVGFDFVGVARGDVKRIVLHLPGEPQFTDWTIYDRGATWGQFSSAVALRSTKTVPQLRIYGDKGLVQVLRLDLRPGQQRIYG
jgi:hypothetical protein